MRSPLGPSLANAFLIHHEQNWLDRCPLEYRSLYYRRYVDIFVLFKSTNHLKRFQGYLNSCHVNVIKKMSFTIETEQNSKISLEVNVICEQGKFTSVYRKPTFGSVYTHFDRFLSNTYKIGMVLHISKH